MKASRRTFTAGLSVLALSGMMLAAGSAAPVSAAPLNTKLETHHSGKCLDVANASIADGGTVNQWECYDTPNQEWKLVQRPNGYFTLVARHSGKCLEVAGGNIYDGTGVVQQTCAADRPYQEWRLL